MHTLFTREHNSIVDRLRVDYPDKNGEWLFQKARLINAALIVKIHATEWSHALLQSPTLQYSMRGEWWGALGEAYFKAFGRPLRNELLSGIPSSPQEHYAAPFSITEEFTAVYRLHSLIPDDFSFRRHCDDRLILACSFADVMAGGATQVHRKVPFDDVIRSALAIQERWSCTITRCTCAGCPRTSTRSRPMSPRPTSCATASAACRVIAPSAACCG